jgi:hypothetical protein
MDLEIINATVAAGQTAANAALRAAEQGVIRETSVARRQPDLNGGALSASSAPRRIDGEPLMTERDVRREIIYATNECKYYGKPLREYIDRRIDVETFATMLVFALMKNGLKLDDW